MPANIEWKSAGLTHVGNVRAVNEDAMLDLPQVGIWAVADGMGGHAAGDVASQLVVSALAALSPGNTLASTVNAIEDALVDVNTRLLALADSGVERRVIGSTVVVLAVSGDGFAVCAWAGDSRLYRLRGQELEQLSQDHSQVEEMVVRGELLREQAENHPLSNVITRAVGGDRQLFVDLEWVEWRAGDRYLLCSDGLYKELTDQAIGAILAEHKLPQQAAHGLVSNALAGACKDNVSVVVVDL